MFFAVTSSNLSGSIVLLLVVSYELAWMASKAAQRFLVCAVLSTGVYHFLSVLLSAYGDGTRGPSSFPSLFQLAWYCSILCSSV